MDFSIKLFDSIDGGYFVECLWYKRCESNWDEDVSEEECEIDQANKKHASDVANNKDQFIGEINETEHTPPLPTPEYTNDRESAFSISTARLNA